MIRMRLLCAALLTACAVFPNAAVAQAQPAPVIRATDPTTPSIRFDVVSIRRSHAQYSRGPGFTDDGFSVENNSPTSLLYSLGSTRVDGIPDWAHIEGYDIRAKVADSDVEAWKHLSRQQRALAVRAMMEDRFSLKWHVETRVTPGFALVVAKEGLKIKDATPGDLYPKGFKNLSGGPLLGVLYETGPGVISAQAITMPVLADSLQGPTGKPVIDQTGLTGKYDFTWKHDAPPPGSAPASADPAAASEPTGTSVFTEIQEQLGLKLVPGAKVPQEFLVVDHIERPTEN